MIVMFMFIVCVCQMIIKVNTYLPVMLTRPQSYEAVTHEAEAKTHEAKAKTHEAEARFYGLEAEAEAKFEAKFMRQQRFEKPKNF